MIRNNDQGRNAEAARWFNEWLKRNKPQLKHYYVGVAMVSSSERWLKLYKPLAKAIVLKMFGCPGTLLTTESEALAWLNDKLSV